MTRATLAGLVAIGLPAFIVALIIFWRRQKTIVAFAMALLTVGLGYLAITGAAATVGRMIPGLSGWIAEGPVATQKPQSAMPEPGKISPAKREPVRPEPNKPATPNQENTEPPKSEPPKP